MILYRINNNDYYIAIMTVSFALGFILSPFSGSLVIVLSGALIFTLLSAHYCNDYNYAIRLAVVFPYIIGWGLGKMLNGANINIISDRHDKLVKDAAVKKR